MNDRSRSRSRLGGLPCGNPAAFHEVPGGRGNESEDSQARQFRGDVERPNVCDAADPDPEANDRGREPLEFPQSFGRDGVGLTHSDRDERIRLLPWPTGSDTRVWTSEGDHWQIAGGHMSVVR
jgi:hypothetical protein